MIFPSPLVFGIIWTEQRGPGEDDVVKIEYVLKLCHKTNKRTKKKNRHNQHPGGATNT